MLVAPPVWGPLLSMSGHCAGGACVMGVNVVGGSTCSAFALGIAPCLRARCVHLPARWLPWWWSERRLRGSVDACVSSWGPTRSTQAP